MHVSGQRVDDGEDHSSGTNDRDHLVEKIAAYATERSLTVACAESLTGGAIASALARGNAADTWFAGGIVSYMSEVKFRVLGVSEGPVVTSACAQQMAEGVTTLLGADASVAVTGVGGPDEQEGQPPGTVFIATRVDGRTDVSHHHFTGDPGAVLDQTVTAAVAGLLQRLASEPA